MMCLDRGLSCILAASILVTAGCASKNPYHDVGGAPRNCVDPATEECSRSYYQEYVNYDLAFAEFSERGNVFNSNWIKEILDRIRAQAEDKGVVVVTFIHGWKHNADESDRNLQDFKESLNAIAEHLGNLHGRRVVGVYIGWRGASLDIPWIENLTFWDRKAVAEEVGKGGVTNFLLDLDRVSKARPKNAQVKENVLVIVGHSFGGAILVSATAEVLAAGAINRKGDGTTGNSIGDAVVVLNPAIEADQSLSLVEASIEEDYPANQNPVFISISSDADAATHYSFPIGQTVGLLFTWHQHDLKRDYYHERPNGHERPSGDPPLLKEEHLDATTVGNFAPYLTHRLTAETTDKLPRLDLQPCDQVPDQCAPRGLTTLSGQPTIGPLPRNYPLYFIKTDGSVITGHNDIFNPVVRAFLVTIIDDIVRRILTTGAAAPPILAAPDLLNERFQQFYPNDAER